MTIASLFVAASLAGQVVTFEDVPLGPQGYYNGSNMAGGFTSGGTFFNNTYNPAFGGYWNGWSASATTDTTTAGYTNQYSAYPGGGDGSATYAVAYDTSARIALPAGTRPTSARVANTTYAALSMRDGDGPGGFAKKFGGASGNDPDYFILTLTGNDPAGTSVAVTLADFRFADNAQDYILGGWATVNLAPLGNATAISVAFASSDVTGGYINTPTYFALDNLTLSPVPEPGAFGLLAVAGFVLARRLVPTARSASKGHAASAT